MNNKTEQFDDLVYEFMLKVAELDGKRFEQYSSSEFLQELREGIIKVSANHWLDLKGLK